MVRKTFVVLLVGLLLASVHVCAAQQLKRVPHIGFLFTTSGLALQSRIDTFRQGLRDLGYIEGQNIIVEYRYTEGKQDLTTELAAELSRLNVDLIVASSTPAILAIKKASTAMPLVFTSINDPVASGFVTSLARPGGNMTGLTILGPELSGKRLELLRSLSQREAGGCILESRCGSKCVQLNPSCGLHTWPTASISRGTRR